MAKKVVPEADVYKQMLCANCREPITKYRLKKAIKARWLPLCVKCDPYIRKQLEECLPLMKAMLRKTRK